MNENLLIHDLIHNSSLIHNTHHNLTNNDSLRILESCVYGVSTGGRIAKMSGQLQEKAWKIPNKIPKLSGQLQERAWKIWSLSRN